MRAENSVSMLAYLRQAIEIWMRYPIALTAPMFVSSWFMQAAFAGAHHLPKGWGAAAGLGAFALSCVLNYTAHAFLSRAATDVTEQRVPDWNGAISLCFRPSTLRVGAGLFWRLLLWLVVAMLVGAAFVGASYSVALIGHHKLGHAVVTRSFTWITILIAAAFFARYEFAIPYLAFSFGSAVDPISLSISRTKPVLRPLIWLTVCGSAAALAVSEIFRVIGLHLAFVPGWEFAWNMLRVAVEYVPYAWFAIAITLFAYQDWVAMRTGGALVNTEKRAIALIDGLPAYLPPEQR